MVPDAFEEDPSGYRTGQGSSVIRQGGRPGHAQNARRKGRLCVLHRSCKGEQKEGNPETTPRRRPAALQSPKVKEVFASVEEDNEPSEALFASEGFRRTSINEV